MSFSSYIITISILAPTRGATGSRINHLTSFSDFNPRSHEGSDKVIPGMFLLESISILAPTRGATTIRHFTIRCTVFQSSLPRGERQNIAKAKSIERKFQSSLPRGERQQFSPKSSLFSQQKLSKIFNLNNKLF